MKKDDGIYAETLMRSGVDEIWKRTQDPALHKLWDLRFSDIEYIPKKSEDEQQKLLYITHLGFGMRIEGEGESTGTATDDEGRATSALRFWSADRKSLIEEGSGYWRYVPSAEGTRFLTWYDYRTRFGALGRFVDRLVYRPFLRWATAWSFDRLRLWIDEGVHPRTTANLAVIHAVARLGIVFTWLWHGLVPKVIFAHADEQTMMIEAGLSVALLPLVGVSEALIGVAGLVLWNWRAFFLLNVLLMFVTLGSVAVTSPWYLKGAFNPVTLNSGMIVMSIVGYLAASGMPSAARCIRRQSKEEA